jgi:predicted phosphodiesterase
LDRLVKLALISDIHANLQALQATLDDIAAQSVDRIVCLGDIVGYNTNPGECIALVRRADCLCVAGNHDRAVSRQITTETFSNTAARAAAWTRQRLGKDELAFLAGLPLKAEIAGELIAVHGALHPETGGESVRLDNDESRGFSFEALMTDPSGARICAFGHTHHAAVHEFRRGHIAARPEDEVHLRDDAYYLVNPGAVGEPRGADRRASYMVVDLVRRVVTVHRVAYDAAATLRATRQAGLAPPLSFLPAPVRQALKSGLRALRLEEMVRNALPPPRP